MFVMVKMAAMAAIKNLYIELQYKTRPERLSEKRTKN